MEKIKYLFPTIIGTLGFITLISLGNWQLDRLEWKLGKIKDIELKLSTLSVNIPDNPSKNEHQYLSVEINGRTLNEEIHILTSTKQKGPGFKIISPMILENGTKILVDLGFVPEIEKNNKRNYGFTTIKGNLLWPNEVDYFTPEPNYNENIWFARDLKMLSKELGTEEILVIASYYNLENNIIQMPINTNLPNNHLQYAITWFSLSVVWFGMTLYWVLKLKKSKKRD